MLFLTLFEFLLHAFHKALLTESINLKVETATWVYLLEQQYMSFIGLDIYTVHEKRHLLDVKRILETTFKLWLILFVLVLMGIVFYKKYVPKVMKEVGRLGLALTFILLLTAVNFIAVFEFFHLLLFHANTWVFPESSMLIKLFPLIYFQQFFAIFVVLSLLLFLTLFFFSNPRSPKTSS
ncbi:MAG: Unknown protein [uncultured Sulfurovum sp.]|uniref:Integral membrane protein n=1 Tax=uncultured Sulfurovum sp. TaxID=269237 RepID=A0A6S6TMT3_9BACT|nr:MAG: Unknown protein [uncultured Sulfurovum sp.]